MVPDPGFVGTGRPDSARAVRRVTLGVNLRIVLAMLAVRLAPTGWALRALTATVVMGLPGLGVTLTQMVSMRHDTMGIGTRGARRAHRPPRRKGPLAAAGCVRGAASGAALWAADGPGEVLEPAGSGAEARAVDRGARRAGGTAAEAGVRVRDRASGAAAAAGPRSGRRVLRRAPLLSARFRLLFTHGLEAVVVTAGPTGRADTEAATQQHRAGNLRPSRRRGRG